MFALVGTVVLLVLLAGHYSYNNASDGMFDLFAFRPNQRPMKLTCPAPQKASFIDNRPIPLHPNRPNLFSRNRFPPKSGKVGRMIRKTRQKERPDTRISGAP